MVICLERGADLHMCVCVCYERFDCQLLNSVSLFIVFWYAWQEYHACGSIKVPLDDCLWLD